MHPVEELGGESFLPQTGAHPPPSRAASDQGDESRPGFERPPETNKVRFKAPGRENQKGVFVDPHLPGNRVQGAVQAVDPGKRISLWKWRVRVRRQVDLEIHPFEQPEEFIDDRIFATDNELIWGHVISHPAFRRIRRFPGSGERREGSYCVSGTYFQCPGIQAPFSESPVFSARRPETQTRFMIE